MTALTDIQSLEQWLQSVQLNGELSLEVTARLTDSIASWGAEQGWTPRFEVPSVPIWDDKKGKMRRGRVDVVFDRPGRPGLAVEIDSRNNERALAKLVAEVTTRAREAIWVRWGPSAGSAHSFTGASSLDPTLVVPDTIKMLFLDIMCHKKRYYRPAIDIIVSPPTTIAEIDDARTPRGGWTRDQLKEWGVPWPPPHGWRDRLIQQISRTTTPPQ